VLILVSLIGALLAVAGAVFFALVDASGRDDLPAAATPPLPRAPAPGASNPLGVTSPAAVRLDGVDAFRLGFRRPPRAGIVFDLDTGEVFWRRQPHRRLPIASLTKIMTALVVVERARPRGRVKITRAALRYSGSGVGVLPKGKRVPLDAVMHGLLLPSGNDAAIALADHVAGSERRFVRLMNRRARGLRLSCTRFVSSHGLEAGNRSCAADLAALTRVAMQSRRIARIVRKLHAAPRFPIKGGRLFLTNTNPLLRTRYPGTIGLKTGYTNRAGLNFVGVVRRRGRTFGVVLLRSPDPAAQTKKLLDKSFRLHRIKRQ
jgi:D-alanyl-D-alanine carboxypeptidase (penicillin-binding protein 5/6)